MEQIRYILMRRVQMNTPIMRMKGNQSFIIIIMEIIIMMTIPIPQGSGDFILHT